VELHGLFDARRSWSDDASPIGVADIIMTARMRMLATLPAASVLCVRMLSTGPVAYVLPPLLREVQTSPPADLPALRRVVQCWHDQVLASHPDAHEHAHPLHRGVGPLVLLHVSRVLLRLLQPRWHSPKAIARHLGQTLDLSKHLTALSLPHDAARRTVGKWQSAVLLATTPVIKALDPVDRVHCMSCCHPVLVAAGLHTVKSRVMK